jgi:TM2 domain-containing membrane protein YozV
MEYTDAPPTESPTDSTDTMPCPYCGAPLQKNAQRCAHCDWTRQAAETAEPKASDAMAIVLSIIPGLGHIYKGHRMMGAVILFVITPAAIAFAILAALASAGWGILMLIPYWGAVMLHVWAIKDKISPRPENEEEQY